MNRNVNPNLAKLYFAGNLSVFYIYIVGLDVFMVKFGFFIPGVIGTRILNFKK